MIGPVLQSRIGTITDLFPGRATQTAKAPFTVYSIQSVDPSETKQAVSGVDVYTVRLNVCSEVLTDVETLAASIRTALDMFSGTIGSTVVDSIRYLFESDSYDDGAQYYIRSVDYKIRIKR